MRGEVCREERRARRVRHVLGQIEDPLRVKRDTLRETAAPARERDDASPVELAGDLRAEARTAARASAGTCPRADQHVREVDSCGAHVDDRALRLGTVLDRERRADLVEDGRFHDQRGSRFSRNAATPSCPSSELGSSTNASISRSSLRSSRVSRSSA